MEVWLSLKMRVGHEGTGMHRGWDQARPSLALHGYRFRYKLPTLSHQAMGGMIPPVIFKYSMHMCFVSRNSTFPQGASAPSRVGDSLIHVPSSETHHTAL